MSDQQTETALPQGVQELIDLIDARLSRNVHGHGFAIDPANCATCRDEEAHRTCNAFLVEVSRQLQRALEQGRARAPAAGSAPLSSRWQELFWALPPGPMRHKLRALEIDTWWALRDRNVPADLGCRVPPDGWWCSREPRHDGPCAARPLPAPPSTGAPAGDRREP